MRDSNHIVMGVATAVVLTESHLLLQSCSENTLAYRLSSGIQHIITDTGLPMWFYFFIGISLYLLGVILPDVDSPYSMIGKKLHVPVEHRTWLHSIWFALIFAVGSIWVRVLCFLSFGIVVHLFFDSFSRSGIQWFYPFPLRRKWGKKSSHILKLYHTSQVSEYVFVGVVILLTVIYSVFTIQQIYHIFPL